jgi:CBS domain-containing protein
MKIRDIMSPSVEIVSPDCTLQEAALLMRQYNIGALPIHDGDDRLSGMITDRDVTVQAVASGVDANKATVKDYVTSPIVYCFDDQDTEEALRLMTEKRLRRLVVLNRQKRLVGIVSLGDIACRTAEESISGKALKEISRPSPSAQSAVA